MKDTLTLWDIDGNLVNVYKFHTPSYQKGIETVFNVTLSLEEIEKNYGKPSNEVIAIPLRKKGIKEEVIQQGLNKVWKIYSNNLLKGIKESNNDVILPGVSKLLDEIKNKNIPMGIVTGNIKKAGEAIIKATDLEHYFDKRINNYAENVKNRTEIVSNAIKAAKENNIITENAKIFVFGDTPSDIKAAKENNCISIAVIKNSNTQNSSPGGDSYNQRKAQLIKAKPDYLFDDYTNTNKVLEILN